MVFCPPWGSHRMASKVFCRRLRRKYQSRPSGVQPMRGMYWSVSAPVSMRVDSPLARSQTHSCTVELRSPAFGYLNEKALL